MQFDFNRRIGEIFHDSKRKVVTAQLLNGSIVGPAEEGIVVPCIYILKMPGYRIQHAKKCCHKHSV